MLQLRLQKPVKLITSFNRPNIHYSVVLLDVQKAATVTTISNSSSWTAPTSRSASPAADTATANVARGVGTLRGSASNGKPAADLSGSKSGLTGVLKGSGILWEDAETEESDVDSAGYEHLLQLLSTPTAASKVHHQKQQQQNLSSKERIWKGPVSIVYALKRSTVDTLVRRLSGAGFAVAGYHAALPDAAREGVLHKWRAGELQVVVATVAFGMGVDKGGLMARQLRMQCHNMYGDRHQQCCCWLPTSMAVARNF